jgi:subtilisin family serine protease
MTRLYISLFFLIASYQLHAENYLVFLNQKSAGNPVGISALSKAKKEQKYICLNEKDQLIDQTYLQLISAVGCQIIGCSRWLNAVLVQTEPTMLKELRKLPFVIQIVALENHPTICLKQEMELPNGALLNSKAQLQMLGIDRLHMAGYTGKGIIIAVFDNGFTMVNELYPYKKLYEEKRIIASKNFVKPNKSVYDMGSDGDHGSRVLSTMAAVQSPDFIGAAYDATYVLAVTEDMTKEGSLEEWNWLMAAEWADSIGADIISSSLGYATNFTYGDTPVYADLDGNTMLISKAANIAASRGLLVVNSAGNEGTGAWRHIVAPADADSCLAVGSVNQWGIYSSFSSMGPTADGRIKPNVSAMGELTITLLPQGYLKTGNGTSFACPLIAGLAACLWQTDSSMSNMTLFNLIQNNASRANNPDTFIGYGIPSAAKIYEKLYGKQLPIPTAMSNYLRIFPNPSSGMVKLSYFNYQQPLDITFELFNNLGQLVSSKKQYLPQGYQEISVFDGLFEARQGVYFLRVIGLNQEIIFENKIVIAE